MVRDHPADRRRDRLGHELARHYDDVRLGLVALPKVELPGHGDYQLLEGLPDYVDTMRELRQDRTSRGRMRKGHVILTALGQRLVELAMKDSLPDPEDT